MPGLACAPEGGTGRIIKKDRPALNLSQAKQSPQQGGLSRTVGPHNSQSLAWVQGEIYIPQSEPRIARVCRRCLASSQGAALGRQMRDM